MKTILLQAFGRRLSMFAILALLALNTACSSPALPIHDSAPADVAWWSYSDCVSTLRPGESAHVCDYESQRDARSLSYSQYVNGSILNDQSVSYGSGSFRGAEAKAFDAASVAESSDVGSAEMDAAYRNYLSTLDEDTLLEMAAFWKDRAAERTAGQ